MNKIGFRLTRTDNGFNVLETFNEGEWCKKATDIREYLQLFDGIQKHGILTFLSFDEEGCYLTLLSPIESRAGDNLCAWIYIPKEIEISGNEVIKIYDSVSNGILSGNILDDLFEKEYPDKECPYPYKATTGTKFGYRDISKNSLEDILDSDRYQDYYSQYKEIFLFDTNSGISISEKYKDQLDDLTDKQIVKTYIMKAPTQKDLDPLGKGTKVYIQYGGRKKGKLKENIRIKQGETLKLIAERDRLDPIEKTLIINKEEAQISQFFLTNGQIEWKKTITKSMFHVKTGNEEEIPDARIQINGKELGKKGLRIKEDELSNVSVSVTTDEYEENVSKHNLREEEEINIILTQVRSFVIRMPNKKTADVTMKSKYLPIDKKTSPISGFHYEDESCKKLIPDNEITRTCKHMTQGFLACAVIVTITVAYVYASTCQKGQELSVGNLVISQRTEDKQAEENSTYDTAYNKDQDSINKVNKAFTYLQNKEKWNKAEMDTIPLLENLYDDLNEFRLGNIISRGENFCNSENYKKIYDAACRIANAHINIIENYNRTKDTEITIKKYINYLNNLKQND